MARRRGMATALQAALSAAAGGFAGYAQQQEAKRTQERQQAMDLIGILQAGGRLEGSAPAAIGPAPTGIGAGGKLTSKAAPPPPTAMETAIEVPGLGRVMMGGPTPAEQRELARQLAARAEQQGKADKQRAALQDVLAVFPESEIPSRYRQAISSGVMSDIVPAITQARAGRAPAGSPGAPSLATSRLISASNAEADVYVQAAGGDAARAEEQYKRDNPTGRLSSRYFQAAATRFQRRASSGGDLMEALIRAGYLPPQE